MVSLGLYEFEIESVIFKYSWNIFFFQKYVIDLGKIIGKQRDNCIPLVFTRLTLGLIKLATV